MNERTQEITTNIVLGIICAIGFYLAFFVYNDWFYETFFTVAGKKTPIDPFWQQVEEWESRT
jgi:hypothetical protein